MIKMLFILFFPLLLLSQNPKPFAVLGDTVYDNVVKIEQLKTIDSYKLFTSDIDEYIAKVNDAKKIGFALENDSASVSKSEYLNILRDLLKTNDYFLRSVLTNYRMSMQTKNNLLFSEIINSGLMDTAANKQEIIDYYYANKDDINASGVISDFLNADAELKSRKETQRKVYKTKQELAEEKIQRLRARDKREHEALEEKLQKDLKDKQVEIREEQKKELR